MSVIVQVHLRPLDTANFAEFLARQARFDLARGRRGPLTALDPADDPARSLLGEIDPAELLGQAGDQTERLQETVARRYGVAPEQVVPTIGASQAIVQALIALLRSGDHVVVERPTYEPLYRVPELLGATVTRIDRRLEDGWQLVPERVAKVLTSRTRAVVLTNLHSASGVACAPRALAELAALAARVGAVLLVDEVHLDFAFDPTEQSAGRPACLVADTAISFSSVSKALGLPLLRAGWLVARDPEAVRALRLAADYLHVRVPAASALLAARALEHVAADMSQQSARQTTGGLRILERWAQAEPRVEYVPPHAGLYALVRLPPAVPDLALAQHLRDRYETLVVPGSLLEAPGCLRLGLHAPGPQLEQGLANISAALDDLAGPREIPDL
jgi:aspartate/methionine/tyrosine aminotransferase